jgi:hypothetical protein
MKLLIVTTNPPWDGPYPSAEIEITNVFKIPSDANSSELYKEFLTPLLLKTSKYLTKGNSERRRKLYIKWLQEKFEELEYSKDYETYSL